MYFKITYRYIALPFIQSWNILLQKHTYCWWHDSVVSDSKPTVIRRFKKHRCIAFTLFYVQQPRAEEGRGEPLFLKDRKLTHLSKHDMPGCPWRLYYNQFKAFLKLDFVHCLKLEYRSMVDTEKITMFLWIRS